MSDWLEKQNGIDIYLPTPSHRRKRGYRVFVHTPDYTGKPCLVIHAFYINKEGKMKRHYYNRKSGDKYVPNYYMVSIPTEQVMSVVDAMSELVGGVKPDGKAKDKDYEKDIEQYA